MTKNFCCVVMLLLLCACVKPALAMGELITVTKETQAQLGLNYTLVAERIDTQAVLVQMEIPRTGKLKNIRSVSMRIGEGRPIVAAALQTTPGKNGSWIVSFQVSPDLAEKCSIDLIIPSAMRTYEVYAVELKGYMTRANVFR